MALVIGMFLYNTKAQRRRKQSEGDEAARDQAEQDVRRVLNDVLCSADKRFHVYSTLHTV